MFPQPDTLQYPCMELQEVRAQFPILAREIHGRPLVYLDNAATTQKPESVITAISEYYRHHNANVHRGVHTLSDESTHLYEQARKTIAQFFGVPSEQFIATRNTTEAMNLLVQMWRKFLQPDDVIVISFLEHHSNFVPWQKVAQEVGCELVVLPLEENGTLAMETFRTTLESKKDRLRVISLAAVSNVLGAVAPLPEIHEVLTEWGVRQNVLVAVDAAQAAAHMPCQLSDWRADALTFSGHKMYGPMGIGGLIVSASVLQKLEPALFGGGMIAEVHVEETSFHPDANERFTAGTPDVASLIGLQAAIEFLQQLGWDTLQQHEHDLVQYAYQRLSEMNAIRLVGPVPTADLLSRVGSVAWVYEGVHAHDVAQILDRSGVAVRSGHHCTMPLHESQNWIATTRASFGVYNTREDIDRLVNGLQQVQQIFGK